MEGKLDEGFEAMQFDLAAVKTCTCNFFKAISQDIRKRDMVALANAATLKRSIDDLQAMVQVRRHPLNHPRHHEPVKYFLMFCV